MSIDTLTGDEFSRLDYDEHCEALAQYDAKLHEVAHQVASATPGSAAHVQHLDQLGRLATLRKVHRVRLLELEDPAVVPAPTPYPFAELDQLPT
jgi:hypothetical protein